MDEISSIAQPKGTPAIQPINPTEPLIAQDSDVEAFQAMMKAGNPPQDKASGAFDGHAGISFDPTLRGKTPIAVDSNHSAALGDTILKGIQATSEQYQTLKTGVESKIQAMSDNPTSMTSQNLLSLQVNLMQLGTHVDIASKIAGKLNQGVQTLFKNQ
jgi:type III secretion system YscI/HrpB-like protein